MIQQELFMLWPAVHHARCFCTPASFDPYDSALIKFSQINSIQAESPPENRFQRDVQVVIVYTLPPQNNV
jgi:hypothetical protein